VASGGTSACGFPHSKEPMGSRASGSYPWWRGRSSSYSVRTLLIAFGAAVVAPFLVLVSALLYWSAASERARLEGRVLQVANELVEDLDREINRSIALLQTLATSPLVTGEDWPAFYKQAKAALADPAYLVLVDATGRQLVNTFVPYGDAPSFTGDFETVRSVSQSRQPIVSNLFDSLVVKRPVSTSAFQSFATARFVSS
jgi:hypothetical protein